MSTPDDERNESLELQNLRARLERTEAELARRVEMDIEQLWSRVDARLLARLSRAEALNEQLLKHGIPVCDCGDTVPPDTDGACGTCHSQVENERDELAAIVSLMQAALGGEEVSDAAASFPQVRQALDIRACVTTCSCGDGIMPGTGALCGNCVAARTVL